MDATVTTVPFDRSRKGRAARTTAAVPSRLTATTFSQTSAGTSDEQAAGVGAGGGDDGVEPAGPLGERADGRLGGPAVGQVDQLVVDALGLRVAQVEPRRAGRRRRGRRATTAAPRPDAPPVTRTVPGGAYRARVLASWSRSGGGAALEVGQDHGLAAPRREQGGFGQVGRARSRRPWPTRRAAAVEHRLRGVLVEDDDGRRRSPGPGAHGPGRPGAGAVGRGPSAGGPTRRS